MKKYFLDERYKKVTYRVCIVLSTIVGLSIIADNVNGTEIVYRAKLFLFGFFVAFASGWIIAALPPGNENKP